MNTLPHPLKGQHAVVTGGGSGIGAAIAHSAGDGRRSGHVDGPGCGAARVSGWRS